MGAGAPEIKRRIVPYFYGQRIVTVSASLAYAHRRQNAKPDTDQLQLKKPPLMCLKSHILLSIKAQCLTQRPDVQPDAERLKAYKNQPLIFHSLK